MIDENDNQNANQDVLDEETSGDEGASPDLDRLGELERELEEVCLLYTSDAADD